MLKRKSPWRVAGATRDSADAQRQNRHQNHKPGERPRYPNIEKDLSGVDRRADPDEGAKRS